MGKKTGNNNLMVLKNTSDKMAKAAKMIKIIGLTIVI